MIPTIFYNFPGVQIVVLIAFTFAYQTILASLKAYENQNEYKLDVISEYLLSLMQIHMLLFMDGGLLSGTPNNVSLDN